MSKVTSRTPHRVFVCLIMVSCSAGVVYAQNEAIPQPVLDWQQAARQAMKQADYETAHRSYGAIVSAYPATEYAVEAQRERTLLYLHHGQRAQADAAMEKMWEYRDTPGVVAALHDIKNHYWLAGYRDESQALCERIYAAFPESPLAAVVLADYIRGSIALNDPDTARRNMDKLWTRHDEHEQIVELLAAIKSEYWRQGYRQESQALCEHVIEAFPDHPDTAKVHRDYICGQIAMGMNRDARREMEHYWSRYQSHPDYVTMTRHIASYFHRRSHDFGIALELNLGLLEGWPNHPHIIEIERDIIAIYLDLGAYEIALSRIAALKARFADHPSLASVLNSIGHDCRRTGQYSDAVEIYEAVLTLSPSEQESLYAYAEMSKAGIQRLSVRTDPNETETFADSVARSEAAINKIITAYPTVQGAGFHVFQIAEEYYFLGERLAKAGRSHEARQAFETAIGLWQNNRLLADRKHAGMAAYYSAVASDYIDDAVSAMSYYQEVVQDYPDYDKAWHARFMVARSAEKLSAAGLLPQIDAAAIQLEAYQGLLDKDPNSPVHAIVLNHVQTLSR